MNGIGKGIKLCVCCVIMFMLISDKCGLNVYKYRNEHIWKHKITQISGLKNVKAAGRARAHPQLHQQKCPLDTGRRIIKNFKKWDLENHFFLSFIHRCLNYLHNPTSSSISNFTTSGANVSGPACASPRHLPHRPPAVAAAQKRPPPPQQPENCCWAQHQIERTTGKRRNVVGSWRKESRKKRDCCCWGRKMRRR